MFKLGFSVFILLSCLSFGEAEPLDELKQKYVETIIDCSEDHPISADDLEVLKSKKVAQNESVKCFFACVYKKTGMMNDNGELWIDGVNQISQKYLSDDPVKMNKSVEFTEACRSENVINADISEKYDDALPGCSYWTSEVHYDHNSEAGDNSYDELPIPTTVKSQPVSTDAVPLLLTSGGMVSQVLATSSATEQCAEPQVLVPQVNDTSSDNAAAAPELVPELDAELMEILGADPTKIIDHGKDIHKDLALRLCHIATTGLSKENRKELKEKYLVPGNCRLIKAPTLNPEIRAALVESQFKRDKAIENKQILMSCALSSIGEAITMMLLSNQKNPELLKILMDTARILGDIQHSESVTRRIFILSTLKKDLKDQLEKTKIDETLFGNNLSDTLKSAKNINKSGAELRSASTSKPVSQKPTKLPTKSLNFRAPPNGRRLPPSGGARVRAPNQSSRMTSMPTQHNSSRTSSRQQAPRHRR